MRAVVGQATGAPPVGVAPGGTGRAGIRLLAPLGVVALLLVGSTAGLAVAGGAAFDGFVARLHLYSAVVAVSFALTAALVLRSRPGNRLGLLATAIAWSFGVALLLDRYAHLGHERGWPGVGWALWVAQWWFVPALWSIPTLLLLLFPDGRLPVGRGRAVAALAVSGMAAGTLGWALSPYGRVDAAPAVPLANPVGTEAGVAVFALGAALWAGAVVGSLALLGLRVVRSRGAERAQLSWLLLGTAGAMVAVAVGAVLGDQAVPSVGIALLPAGLAIGVVRHRLWDVQLVVQRSLVYGSLVAIIVVVYAVTVGLLGSVLGDRVGAPLVATGLVAVGVQPVRDRLQRLASHVVYGDREDPYAAVSRLGAQLDAGADRGGLLVGVTEALARTMRLRGAAVTVEEEVLAQVGDLGPAPRRLPLTVAGEPVGTLLVGVADGDELGPRDVALLSELARHVSSVVQAERLQVELAASRSRLVTAREEERRRIRRDLHDELGPTLAAIANEVERAGLEAAHDPEAAAARLDELAERVRSTVRDVRALVEGLRPAALDQLRLDGAVRELARRLGGGPLTVDLEIDGDMADLPAAVEVGAYRIVGEALTNVVRHAGASRASVVLRRAGRHLEVVVEDDGGGLAAGSRAGVGRRSMAERAAELGGTLAVSPRAGGGVRVRAILPVVAP